MIPFRHYAEAAASLPVSEVDHYFQLLSLTFHVAAFPLKSICKYTTVYRNIQ